MNRWVVVGGLFAASGCGRRPPVSTSEPRRAPPVVQVSPSVSVAVAAPTAPLPSAAPPPSGALELAPGIFFSTRHVAEELPGCSYDAQVPKLSGLNDATLEQRINTWLAQTALNDIESACEGAPPEPVIGPWSETRAVEVDVARDQVLGLRFEIDSYTGGAHGSQGSECFVLDWSNGEIFTLVSKLDPTKLARLQRLLDEKVRVEAFAQEAAASGSPVEMVLRTDSTLCLDEQGFFIQASSYELGPYSLGRPRFSFSAEEARALFLRPVSGRLFPR